MAYSGKLPSHKATHPLPVFSQKGSPLLPSYPSPSKNIWLAGLGNRLHLQTCQKLPDSSQKSCEASQIPNSGLLLPSPRATWQEEESCSSTSSSWGPQYPGFLASQSQQPPGCPPPREMGPRDSSQGQEKTWPAVEQGGGRCQLTHPPLQAQWGKESLDSPSLPGEESSPSSQQEAEGATSQTTGVTAAPHRVMKDFGAERVGPGRGQHYHMGSSCSSAPASG